MIVIIRGHVRDAFETSKLYFFLTQLKWQVQSLEIYIHTWDVFANSASWRPVKENRKMVTEDTIYMYFGDLSPCIRHIIIDDDSQIQLVGSTGGRVCASRMPVKGWKNYWYGQHRIVDYVFRKVGRNNNAVVVNTRFDLFSNSNTFDEGAVLQFIKRNAGRPLTQNLFMASAPTAGIDNLYLGTVGTMHRLVHEFQFRLDDIMRAFSDVTYQEHLVFYINSRLFDPAPRKPGFLDALRDFFAPRP